MPFPAAVPSHSFLESDTVQRQVLGARDWDQWQREWVYLKAGVVLEQGEGLMSNMSIGTIITNLDTVSAAGSDLITDTGSTFETDGVLTGMMISVHGGTGLGQFGIVLEVQSETVLRIQWLSSGDGKLDTALDTTSDLTVFAPWLGILCANDKTCIGFAQIDVALNSFFWALVNGIGYGVMDTSVAMAENDPLTIGDTSGQLTKVAATDLDSPCATAVHIMTTDATQAVIMAHARTISSVPFGDQFGYQTGIT